MSYQLGWGPTDFLTNLALDPYLPRVAELVTEIAEIEAQKGGGGSGGPGVGLDKVILPLKAFLAYERNPWLPYAIGFGVLAVPFLSGMLVGRAVERRRARKA